MKAIQAGWGMAVTTYREEAITPTYNPFGTSDWNDYSSRVLRYNFLESYYHNTQYQAINTWLATLKSKYGLYQHIRAIYNPAGRVVDLDVAKTYGGSINLENLDGGAIPIAGADDPLIAALIQIMQWSNWQTAKSLYPRYGAMLGDSVLKVVDDRVRSKVRLEVLHPGKLYDVTLDAVGNVKSAIIEYQVTDHDPATGRDDTYIYTEVIDKDEFVTLRDREEYPFYVDATGTPISRWRNEYGFVPLVLTKHIDTGQTWGENAFYKALPKINEANDIASNLHDQIRKSVNPIWFASGFAEGKNLTRDSSDTKRDDMVILYGGTDTSLEAMVANLDIAGSLEALRAVLDEVERSVPELAIERAQDLNNVSGVAVRNMFTGAVGMIEEFRGNYDSGLMRALQMAVSIGGYRGYENMAGYSLDSYGRGDLDFYVKERSVFDDGISEEKHLEILDTVATIPPALARLKLKRLGYAEEIIDEVLTELATAQEQQTRAAVSSFADTIFNGLDQTDPMADVTMPHDEAASVNGVVVDGSATNPQA